jgi:hypothetical protein
MLFGVITRKLRYNLHVVNTHPTHVIIPNSICAQSPEDGRVTPETCGGKLRQVCQVGIDLLINCYIYFIKILLIIDNKFILLIVNMT